MKLLSIAVMLASPILVQAQFNYTVVSNTITITAYTGPGGDVVIPDTIIGLPVTSIQQWAFDPYYTGNGAAVTSVTIPDKVTSIGFEAFEYCDTLLSVNIGAGVVSIGTGAFTYCHSLASITVDTNNPAYSSADGVLFDKNQTLLIQCPRTQSGSYSVPDTVANIGANAFYYCTGLTDVTMGDSVVGIGRMAFFYCSGLATLAMGSNVTGIGASAFVNCTALKEIALPSSVTSIGSGTFSGCTGLTNVLFGNRLSGIGATAFAGCSGLTGLALPDSVAAIGEEAFGNCVGLTNVTLPGSVTNIGAAPFYACRNLTNIGVDQDNSFYSSADGILFNKDQTALIQWPDSRGGGYTVPNTVTNIGAGAFAYAVSLTTVTMDAKLADIASGAFTGCTNLTGVYFNGNAPVAGTEPFGGEGTTTTAFYLPGTTGWGASFAGIPTALWVRPNPLILAFEPNFGVQTNNFDFTVSWATNRSVVVEATANLADPIWTPVATNTLTSGAFHFSDPQWTDYPARYYRVRSP